MKITTVKKNFLCSLVITLFSILKGATSVTAIQTHDTFVNFLQPVDCTKSGTGKFFKKVFNHPDYATEFLPYNFSHLT